VIKAARNEIERWRRAGTDVGTSVAGTSAWATILGDLSVPSAQSNEGTGCRPLWAGRLSVSRHEGPCALLKSFKKF